MYGKSKSEVTKNVVNSAALYVYCKNYSPDTSPEKAYNDWITACNYHFSRLSDVVMMLEKISGYLQIDQDEMRFALQQEHLL